MNTKRFWAPPTEDRRSRHRLAADFYGVELSNGGRYLRRITNVSRDGLRLENPLGDEQPGQIIELELPRIGADDPVTRVKAEVVHVSPEGNVGLRRLESTKPLDVEELGGDIAL